MEDPLAGFAEVPVEAGFAELPVEAGLALVLPLVLGEAVLVLFDLAFIL